MTELDWVCPVCGGELRHADGYLVCDALDGFQIRPVWDMLPKANFVDYKRFRIGDRQGYWEYVRHGHKDAGKRKPGPGVVVGRVFFGLDGWRLRAFRQCKPPRRIKETSQSVAN